jgi:dephospho-CoA kinase
MTACILGLVGGIGSGKSLVAGEFVKHGAYLIVGDQLGHEALEQPEIKEQIADLWGQGIFDERGQIERRKLGAIVFNSKNELRKLESLVFPYIGRRIREEIDKAKASPFIVLDAAVMMEAGWDHACDRIIYVDAPVQIRHRRLREQRGWTEQEIEAREAAQLPVEKKRRRAEYLIDNSGPPARLAEQVANILEEIQRV